MRNPNIAAKIGSIVVDTMSEITLVMPVPPSRHIAGKFNAKFDLSQYLISGTKGMRDMKGMKRFVARLLARNFMTLGDLLPDVKHRLFLKRNGELPLTYLGVIPETSLLLADYEIVNLRLKCSKKANYE